MSDEKLNKDMDPADAETQSRTESVLDDVTTGDYKYGFTTDIDTEIIPKGLSEDTVRFISAKKGEPEWLHTATGLRWPSRIGRILIYRR